MQVLLVLLSFALFLVLYYSVQNGLIFSPDMAISGNGSTNSNLVWYTDSSPSSLPSPWVLSLPLWTWRVVMLAWSAWLAGAFLGWLKWGYKAFTAGGAWRGKEGS